MKFLKTIAIALFALSCNTIAKGEEQEWEYMNTSSWEWKEYDHTYLTFYGKSTTKLDVYNSVAETAEDKRNNRWTSYTAWIDPHTNDAKRAYEITFSVKNEHNPNGYKFKTYSNGKEVWYEGNVYWGITIQTRNSYGGKNTDWTINYANNKTSSGSYPYSYTSKYSSDDSSWSGISDRETRNFRIVYDGISTVKIYGNDGTDLLKTISNTTGVAWVGAKVGTAAELIITNFKVLRKTDYGLAKPEIDRAIQEYNKENYSSTISIISRVLDSYKAAFPYYIRGRAYSSNKYNKAAVDDYTAALSYSCDAELRRNIYFNRGICRLLLDDYDNGVADMRNAGEEGKAFLKEYNLENYQPGQRKASSAGSRNNSSGGSSTPQLKKGNSSSNSNNSTPALRKTN